LLNAAYWENTCMPFTRGENISSNVILEMLRCSNDNYIVSVYNLAKGGR
jgi:hypothetical protein